MILIVALGFVEVRPSSAAFLQEDEIQFQGELPGQLRADQEIPKEALTSLVSGVKGKEIEACTRKCLPICLRGGNGAPGLANKGQVASKNGIRGRSYCLRDCAEACSLTIKGAKGSISK